MEKQHARRSSSGRQSMPAADLAAFGAQRGQLLLRDEQRLARQLQRMRQGKGAASGTFTADLQRAVLAAENRARLAPTAIEYPAELPVTQAREEIQRAIAAHPVVILCGETGSGKTTQLPKLCLDMGRGRRGLIGHTQPRRLAARSVANRIAQELKSPLGQLVGYETRFDRRVSAQSLIKLMTDGILLAELQRDRDLLAYDTIIIDEAHERSLNIDFLLGWLKRLVPRRPELKLIVTSATLDPERLSAHFDGAPILRVEGRAYPVELRYQAADTEQDLETQIAQGVESLWHDRRAGDTLVFLPGEREIREVARHLDGRLPQAEILSLYSRLPAQQQDRVFSSSQKPRVVLSTNVAETSITVPGIRYVVDAGTARINRYSTRLGVQRLQIEPVSQAAANQRAGRCGRVGPGVCLRLFDETDFAARAEFTDPEILRSNLAGVILQMAVLNLGEIDNFPWVDPPDHRQVSEGYRLLQTLGALDDQRRLTRLGGELGRLPLDPRIARIVVSARGTPVQDAVCVLAAALSVQDPHETPPDQQPQARQKHAQWRHPRSDFLSLLNLWRLWQQWRQQHSNRALRKTCREHFVSYTRMDEWESVYRQIADLTGAATAGTKGSPAALPTVSPEQLEALYPAIHKALASGLIDHIGLRLPAEKNERPAFQGPRGRRFVVFPGSTLSKKPPAWILCAQLAQTRELFARCCAEIQPEWLAEVGSHLLKHTFTHPTWNPERAEVQATEYQSLFGLQLLKRTRHYGSIDIAEARRIFILDGLVRGQWPQKPRFLADNLRLVAEVLDKEARLRRPDLLAEEAQLQAWYEARLPDDVCNGVTLKRWLRQASADRGDPGRILRMSEDDVLRPGADSDVTGLFPDALNVAGHEIRLSYEHDPGEDADGVSFHIPLTLLYALPDTPWEWLVPGLRAARIEGLIRSLPMSLRRHCTPAAQYAAALAARMSPDEGDFRASICAHFRQMTGVALTPDDFEPQRLIAHLKPRLLLEDLNGAAVAQAESLAELKQRYAEPARAALQQSAQRDDAAQRWTRDQISDWDFGDLPEHVDLAQGARAYPALTAHQGQIGLALFESPDRAAAEHTAGVRALLLSRLRDRMRDLSRSAQSRLGLALIGAAWRPEALAQEVAERAAAEAWPLVQLRSEQAFRDALMRRGDFVRDAQRRLDDAIRWIQSAADLKQRLLSVEPGWPRAAADIREQLDTLLAPGVFAHLDDTCWPRVGIWLKAVALRLERLPNKPQRDLDFTNRIDAVWRRIPAPHHPSRWLLEEWRVALFAQDLRALGSPNADKILSAAEASQEPVGPGRSPRGFAPVW